jgi:hypothetical protein
MDNTEKPLRRCYSTHARKPIAKLEVAYVLDIQADHVTERELCSLWSHDGKHLGHLWLKAGEAEQLAASLRLAPEGRTQPDWQAIGSPGMNRAQFEAVANKLERAMRELCADQPLGAIAAAVHGLVCRNQLLRDLLLEIDAVCEHYEQQNPARAVAALVYTSED